MTLITCTGFRPEAFALCEKYVHRFDTDGIDVEWIVVSDDNMSIGVDAFLDKGINVVSVDGIGPQRYCTMPSNLHTALSLARGQLVIIIEDDDWYHASYVRFLWNAYNTSAVKLLGFSAARYYSVSTRTFKGRYSSRYSSLCRTAFDRCLADRVGEVCRACHADRAINVDTRIWSTICDRDERFLFPQSHLCVSIKDMPGRGRAGLMGGKMTNADPRLSVLRQWIGDDCQNYERVQNV